MTKYVLRVMSLALMVSAAGCDFVSCDQDVSKQLSSPDGIYVAMSVAVACGATTKDGFWLVLARNGREVDFKRNSFASFEGDEPRMQWVGTKLVVDYGTARPGFKKERFDGIEIEYVGNSQ